MPTNRSKFELLLERFEPRLRFAFLEAIADIRSGVTLRLLVDRLERGDVDGALEVLNIERSAFGPLEIALAEAFNTGGMNFAEDMSLRDQTGSRITFRFGVRNPQAEAWLSNHSAQLVTRIIDDQRTGIRQHLTDGLARGDNPRTTALNVVGRVSPATRSRTGGILGLTSQQERTVANTRLGLSTGDKEAIRAYLKLKRRDKRFDPTVIKALREGTPLPADTVTRITGRLSDRYLQLRGETLALHETFTALSVSKDEGFRQAIASGKVDAAFVFKTWRHSGKVHFRRQHKNLHGTEVRFLEKFVMEDGVQMSHPHDPSAPAEHTIGCGCFLDYRVDYTGQLIARRAA